MAKFPDFSRGQAFLALVIVIGGIVLSLGVTLALVTVSFINSTYGYQATQQAESAATAGAEDALLQLARNNTFSNIVGYSLAAGSSTATITVNQNTPSVNFITVLSIATVSLRTRKIQVILSLNATTGQTSVLSWKDVQ